jgi:hypothetical protein
MFIVAALPEPFRTAVVAICSSAFTSGLCEIQESRKS